MEQSTKTYKKALIILPKKKFEDEEFLTVTKCLHDSNIITENVTCNSDIARGIKGTLVTPDCILDEIDIMQYDAVTLIGGVGAIEHWHNKCVIKLLAEAYDSGKLVCAICLAPVTLANAELLKDRKATAYESAASYLRKKGAIYTGRLVEKADNVITACGPEASTEFASAIINSLGL